MGGTGKTVFKSMTTVKPVVRLHDIMEEENFLHDEINFTTPVSVTTFKPTNLIKIFELNSFTLTPSAAQSGGRTCSGKMWQTNQKK